MHVWTLKAGAERRFRAGYPWVYSNELAHSPREAAPGDPVELRDSAGRFLARGYGHPHTLIAFRALARDPAEAEPWSEGGLLARLRRAEGLRRALGLGAVSHRLVFGEADGLPGLIVDRYRLTTPAQVLVVQAHTAGAERLLPDLLAALEALASETPADAGGRADAWAHTAVVLRNDVGARRLEGLAEAPPQVLRPLPGVELAQAAIRVAAPPEALLREGETGSGVAFQVDLLGGQKTGFYLDQAANVRLAAGLLAPLLRSGSLGEPSVPVRILDLFAYVGQWGAQLSRVCGNAGRVAHVTPVDASATALERAAANVAAAGATCEPLRADAMETLGDLPAASFDVVVADPPAFIKGRKAYPAGRAAYVKLNAAALRLVRPGGLVVTCSCSQLLEETEFGAVLHKAAGRTGTPVRWVARGSQAPDHPGLAEFPEGHYLKCWLGVAG